MACLGFFVFFLPFFPFLFRFSSPCLAAARPRKLYPAHSHDRRRCRGWLLPTVGSPRKRAVGVAPGCAPVRCCGQAGQAGQHANTPTRQANPGTAPRLGHHHLPGRWKEAAHQARHGTDGEGWRGINNRSMPWELRFCFLFFCIPPSLPSVPRLWSIFSVFSMFFVAFRGQ